MTLTNIAPQHSNFNQRAWNQLECMVRNYMEEEIPNEYAYIITGTLGTKMHVNENNPSKNTVRLPEYYWKAFCYVGSSATYSMVYIQVNENDQTSRTRFLWYDMFNTRVKPVGNRCIQKRTLIIHININPISSGDNVMTVSAFTSSYHDGTPIFDSACQNASLGPWFAIKEDWNTYRVGWGCN